MKTQNAMVNKRIDQYAYNDQNQLGKGQFGTVYRGFNTTTNETVAIKVIAMRVLENDYMAKLLINEIDALKKLNSINIVRFIDLKITKNNIYLVTEFCEGGDLCGALAKKKRLTEDEIADIMEQVCGAFKEMKKDNIIHRDLKPANILLHQGQVKIADLGFAKTVSNFQGSILQSTVGSPIYMSPQLLLKQHYTSKCDVWSLGVIIYQLLFGEVPWKALDINSLAMKVRTEPVKFLPGISCSAELKDFILRCLKYEERERMSWDDVFNHPIWAAKKNRTRTAFAAPQVAAVATPAPVAPQPIQQVSSPVIAAPPVTQAPVNVTAQTPVSAAVVQQAAYQPTPATTGVTTCPPAPVQPTVAAPVTQQQTAPTGNQENQWPLYAAQQLQYYQNYTAQYAQANQQVAGVTNTQPAQQWAQPKVQTTTTTQGTTGQWAQYPTWTTASGQKPTQTQATVTTPAVQYVQMKPAQSGTTAGTTSGTTSTGSAPLQPQYNYQPNRWPAANYQVPSSSYQKPAGVTGTNGASGQTWTYQAVGSNQQVSQSGKVSSGQVQYTQQYAQPTAVGQQWAMPTTATGTQ